MHEHVSLVSLVLDRSLPTDVALVRPFVCVRAHVFLHLTRTAEATPAVCAYEWPLARVQSAVPVQVV